MFSSSHPESHGFPWKPNWGVASVGNKGLFSDLLVVPVHSHLRTELSSHTLAYSPREMTQAGHFPNYNRPVGMGRKEEKGQIAPSNNLVAVTVSHQAESG